MARKPKPETIIKRLEKQNAAMCEQVITLNGQLDDTENNYEAERDAHKAALREIDRLRNKITKLDHQAVSNEREIGRLKPYVAKAKKFQDQARFLEYGMRATMERLVDER